MLALLALLAGLLRGWVVWPRPHPPGTDGYYYVVQVEDLVQQGALHVPDASWVLHWLALPARLGAAPEASVAIAASALVSATVLAAWFLGRQLSSGSPAGPTERASTAAWLLALYAACSPTLTHLCADFPKNLGAVPLLLSALGVALGAGRPASVLLALALALGAATAHRSGATMVGLAAAGLLLGRVLTRFELARFAVSRGTLLALLAALGALLLFAALSATLPGLMHPDDLDRVWSQLRTSPWPPPPFSWLPHRHTHPLQVLELALIPWAGLLLGARALRTQGEGASPWRAALLVPLAVALFPWWRADGLDLGYRLGLLAPLVGAPLCAVQLARIPAVSRWLPLGVLGLPMALLGYDPRSAPPFEEYETLLAQIPRPLPELLIVEPGASFFYDHRTGHDALAWAPEPGLDLRRIYRVVWGIRDGEWAAYTPAQALVRPVRLDRDHVYVREDVWEGFAASALSEGEDELRERVLDPRNPSRVRPPSLLRNRKPTSSGP